jgi:hypothetical protein
MYNQIIEKLESMGVKFSSKKQSGVAIPWGDGKMEVGDFGDVVSVILVIGKTVIDHEIFETTRGAMKFIVDELEAVY